MKIVFKLIGFFFLTFACGLIQDRGKLSEILIMRELNKKSSLNSITAQILITPTSNLRTNESGTSIQISVSLNKAPTSDVTIKNIMVSDTAEGKIDKASLTFTPSNWNTIQILTVTGIDDLIVDGDKIYSISFEPCVSFDTEFNGLIINSLSITNVDNDTFGFALTPITGLITSETGTNTSFTIQLTSPPTSTVTIPNIASSNIAEGTVIPTNLIFTAANWNTPQTVTVTGVDDLLSDGNQTFLIQFSAATSSDTNYNGKVITGVSIVNTDNETFGVTVGAISGATTEAGATATFNVVLNSASTSSVTIPIISSNTTEGTVSPSSLTFTAANWNVPQVVTVTGVNDFIQDGSISYTIILGAATSANSNYNGLDPSDVTIVNNDNDTGGYTVVSNNGLTVTDGGQISATFSIKLNTQPTSSVIIPISSSNTGEGTVSPSSITFTAANWSNAQTVTISGVSDGGLDGNKSFTIVLSLPSTSDSVYAALDPPDQSANSCDNDSGASVVFVCKSILNPSTSENGESAQYFVILATDPGEDVTIPVTSSDTSEATVNSPLIINSSNWNQFLASNRITVTGVNDALYDGDISYNVLLGAASTTSMTGSYHGYDPVDINGLINYDNETYFTVSSISGNTSETGTTRTFTIVLPSLPTGNVTFTLSSSNTAEGIITIPAGGNITFTTGNWNIAQTITVTGVNDNVADGNQTFSIDSTSATSADLRYNGKTPSSVNVTNLDAGEKRTFITTTATNGVLLGTTGADAICNADPAKPGITPNAYKALIAVNGIRSGSPLTGWVLAANTKYFRADGTTLIFTSDASSVFAFGTLTNSFSGTNYWTGLTNTWAASGNTCVNWIMSVGTGADGDGTSTSSSSIAASTPLCNQTRYLICVQQ